MSLATFVLFYLMTVFALTWGTTALGYTRQQFLLIQLFGILFFALTIPLSAVLADRHGRRRTLLLDDDRDRAVRIRPRAVAAGGHGGRAGRVAIGLSLMGFTYGPLGTALSELFPDARALHGQLADLQPGRHLRRLARAVRGDVAGEELRVVSMWAIT